MPTNSSNLNSLVTVETPAGELVTGKVYYMRHDDDSGKLRYISLEVPSSGRCVGGPVEGNPRAAFGEVLKVIA